MKDSWKRFLCAAALIPCIGAMAGCDGSTTPPADDNTTPSTPSVEEETPATETLTEAQMYSKAMGAAKKIESGEQQVVSTEITTQQIMSLGEYATVGADNVKTPITDETVKAMLDSAMIPNMTDMLGGMIEKEKIGYDLTTGEKYHQTYSAYAPGYTATGEEGYEVYTAVSADTIKTNATPSDDDLTSYNNYVKHGDKFIHHKFDADMPENVQLTYVSADHFKNAQLHGDGLRDVMEYNFQLSSILDNATLEEFKAEMLQTIDYLNSEFGTTLTGDDFNIVFEFDNLGTQYLLTAGLASKEPVSVEMDGTTQEISVNMTTSFAFTDDKLLSFKSISDIDMATIAEMPLGSDPSVLTRVSIPLKIYMERSILFNDTISDADKVLLDDTRYTFNDADVVTGRGAIIFHIDGVSVGSFDYSGEMGTDLVLTDSVKIELADQVHLGDWYLDEACTIPFSSEAVPKYTSYDINLYAKTTEIQDGYAKFVVKTSDDSQVLMQPTIEFLDVSTAVNLAERLSGDYYEVESVSVNGVEYDLQNNPTLTLESGESYEIVVTYVYSE